MLTVVTLLIESMFLIFFLSPFRSTTSQGTSGKWRFFHSFFLSFFPPFLSFIASFLVSFIPSFIHSFFLSSFLSFYPSLSSFSISDHALHVSHVHLGQSSNLSLRKHGTYATIRVRLYWSESESVLELPDGFTAQI